MVKGKIFIIAGLTALFTVLLDYLGVHLFWTEPQEIFAYYFVGFIGAFLVALLVYPLYQMSRWFILGGGVAWALWKSMMYGIQNFLYRLNYDIIYSLTTTPFSITAFGISNKVFLFMFWLIGHSVSFIGAFLVSYYLVEQIED